MDDKVWALYYTDTVDYENLHSLHRSKTGAVNRALDPELNMGTLFASAELSTILIRGEGDNVYYLEELEVYE